MLTKPTNEVLQDIHDWFKNGLGCFAGRREFMSGRYEIAVVSPTNPLDKIFANFLVGLQRYEKVGCLIIFNDPRFYQEQNCSVRNTIQFLAEQVASITDIRPFDLINGHKLSKKVLLTCPVTNTSVNYYFNTVTFYPQAANKNDPLYDASMFAPYTCINTTSDVFGFSIFVRDEFIKIYNAEVYNVREINTLKSHFLSCADSWHNLSKKTIDFYQKITTNSVCPVHINSNGLQYTAPHKDPAFSETAKASYCHDLPIVYTKPIIEKWINFFKKGIPLDMNDTFNDGVLNNRNTPNIRSTTK